MAHSASVGRVGAVPKSVNSGTSAGHVALPALDLVVMRLHGAGA